MQFKRYFPKQKFKIYSLPLNYRFWLTQIKSSCISICDKQQISKIPQRRLYSFILLLMTVSIHIPLCHLSIQSTYYILTKPQSPSVVCVHYPVYIFSSTLPVGLSMFISPYIHFRMGNLRENLTKNKDIVPVGGMLFNG